MPQVNLVKDVRVLYSREQLNPTYWRPIKLNVNKAILTGPEEPLMEGEPIQDAASGMS